MAVMKAVFDTNILIDYLNGIPQAREEMERYPYIAISAITWMEVMVGADESETISVRAFLSRFSLIQIDADISERTILLRRKHGIRLPDAIIRATAQSLDALLVTRNTKDFPENEPGIRVPYRIGQPSSSSSPFFQKEKGGI